MATTVVFLGPLLTLILLIAIIIIALKFGKSIIGLAINSLLGMLALFLLNFLPIVNIDINIWSILIVALGGIPGLVILLLLDLAGIAF